VESQVVAYTWQALADPGGVQAVPATQAATHAPDEQTLPLPQTVPSAWFRATAQVVKVPVASHAVA
jgi:hypothetical protein